MTFSRFVLLAASIAAPVAFAPALAQEHEVGHWWPTPVGSSHDRKPLADPAGREATATVRGADAHAAKQFNGFVSRFPAGTRSGEVHATPLEDPRLQVPDGGQEGKYDDITLKRGATAASGSGDMTLKGQNILQNALERRPADATGPARDKVQRPSLPPAGAGGSAPWVRVAQPHTTGSVVPPRVGWEVHVGSAPKTALPAVGMPPGATPGGHGAPARR